MAHKAPFPIHTDCRTCQVAFSVLEAIQAYMEKCSLQLNSDRDDWLWVVGSSMPCNLPTYNSGLDHTALTELVDKLGVPLDSWLLVGAHGLLHLFLDQENLLMIAPCRECRQWP